ncbi:MAG: histidine ammonia-lyase [Bradymonadia bacterium]
MDTHADATPLVLGQGRLTIDDLAAVALRGRPVAIDPDRLAHIGEIRRKVEALLKPGAPLTYGVNTGFGALAEVRVEASALARLQQNLIRSHTTGVGAPYPVAQVRAMMLLRANVLILGTSGVRPEVPALLVQMLNARVHPLIPEKGSVGASGDLAPLAHLALALIGEGEVLDGEGHRVHAANALAQAGLRPLELGPKEGLALINGTQAMTADAALVLHRARRLCTTADLAGAISLDALLGTPTAFDPRVQGARGHDGQLKSAENLRRLTADSGFVASHVDCGKVQDPYSLRCMPQVHGASRAAVEHAWMVVEQELNAATDNPLVFESGDALEIISGGNFHGQPVALVCDYLAMALAELANISERRIEQLVNPALSSGLPAFLTPNSGLNSGFMIAQVTAAALVSENKVLAHPASVDSIPSSANREDHVSMGTIAARKARTVLEHAESVLAIELMCGLQGIDLRRPLQTAPPLEAVYALVRAQIPPLAEDRILYGDIDALVALVRGGALVEAAAAITGPLH